MKLGLIDVGGGMRGIYAAGVLDYCLDNDIHFDYTIGVSAGSANIASFLAGQRGRNYRFYHDYSFRKEYMGVEHYLKTGSFLNLEYIYGTLSNSDGEYPLDYDKMMENPADFVVVATNAVSGKPCYFRKGSFERNSYTYFMASSCVPGVDRPVIINNTPYFDGALSDPVPTDKAIEDGCTRYILLLTKPADVLRTAGKDSVIAKSIRKKYPNAADGLLKRAERYNRAVSDAKLLAAEGFSLILAPDDITGVDTLKRDRDALDRLYRKGLHDGQKISVWLEKQAYT